ncbi:MAG: GNAT family N-acetyltransferase [Bacteroidota bacterium]
MMETVHIREGHIGDVEAIFSLVEELGVYEKAGHEIDTSPAQLEKDGFGPNPLFNTYVAVTPGREIVGVAIFYIGYSTWKGKQLYLDDLVVTEAYRRKGVGQQLLDKLISHAQAHGVCQMRWHVLNWNEPAIRFYEKIQAQLEDAWITCKLERNQLAAYQAGGTYLQASYSDH